MFRATDEHGNDDSAYIVCSERVYKALITSRELVLADLAHDKRMRSHKRKVAG